MKKISIARIAKGNGKRAVRTTAAVLAMTVFATAGLLTSCSSSLEVSDDSTGQTEIVVYNWGDYIAEDTVAKFEEAYPQYKVTYRTFETNETMYPNLTNSYDVIIPSDYMVCRLIREGKIQKLNMDLLPDVKKEHGSALHYRLLRPGQAVSDSVTEYAAPYMYCTVGLVYDANKIQLAPEPPIPRRSGRFSTRRT
jgi:spermidine/putrescine-binding protein